MYEQIDEGGNVVRIVPALTPFTPDIPTGHRWVERIEVPTLDQVRQATLESVNREFELAAAALTAGYPRTETLTWPDQQREALAYQADSSASTPFLDALALARGIGREAYIQKTIAKMLLFKSASAALVGKRQKLADQIQAATTVEECAAIVWSH